MAENPRIPTSPPPGDDLVTAYGPAASLILSIPDLQQLADKLQADSEMGISYSDEEIDRLVADSDWGRSTLPTKIARMEEAASYTPEFFGEILREIAGNIRDNFEQAGAVIDDATALSYAEKYYYSSGRNEAGELEVFDSDWLTEKMAGAIDFSQTQMINGVPVYDLEGVAGVLADRIYQQAYAFGIDSSMSNTGFDGWFRNSVRALMQGDMDVSQIDSYMRDEAISMYPGLADKMMGGLTLRQAADPYLKAIQQELELPDIDLDDNLVQSVLNSTDEQGNFKAMNLYDVKLKARSDPRWQFTQQAKQEYTDVAAMIAKDFGFF